MRDELKPFQDEYGFGLDVLDVDDNPVLEGKYNELVPVLLAGDKEICHWYLDKKKLRQVLES